MPSTSPAGRTLDREFLGIRARLIDLAATLERIERSDGAVADDPRLGQIRRSLEILLGHETNRAERVQLAFSLPYQDDWQTSP